MRQWIDKLQEERTLQPEEFRQLLTECDGESLRYINKQAQEVSLRHFGNRIFIRGLIEVSNCCRNNCYYCGIRKGESESGTLSVIHRKYTELLQAGV